MDSMNLDIHLGASTVEEAQRAIDSAVGPSNYEVAYFGEGPAGLFILLPSGPLQLLNPRRPALLSSLAMPTDVNPGGADEYPQTIEFVEELAGPQQIEIALELARLLSRETPVRVVLTPSEGVPALLFASGPDN
ncbi:MAG TPA: hypothetical protein VK983_05150 [Candidatus Limnocylindrales bacterium]|nr:hypothetical protein [Candidatus Limnocylindrales bacterium]